MVFVFGEHYRGTGPILITLTASTAMSCLSMLAHNGLWATDQPRSNFVADVCCMTVTLIAAALLIHPFGALGAAMATLAGSTTAALVRSFTLFRYFEARALESERDDKPRALVVKVHAGLRIHRHAYPIEPFGRASSELRTPLGRTSPMPFVAFAAILIIVAYLSPFEYAWNQSLNDDSDDERPGIAAKEGSLQKQVALGTLGLIGLSILTISSDRLLQIKGPIGWICVAYLSWCAASCIWTDDFAISSRRVIGLWCEVLAGVAVAQRVSPRQFAWLVFACTLTWLGVGILAELSHGTFQPWQPGYRFNGVFYPNIMAGNCLLLIVSSFYLSSVAHTNKRLLQAIGGSRNRVPRADWFADGTRHPDRVVWTLLVDQDISYQKACLCRGNRNGDVLRTLFVGNRRIPRTCRMGGDGSRGSRYGIIGNVAGTGAPLAGIARRIRLPQAISRIRLWRLLDAQPHRRRGRVSGLEPGLCPFDVRRSIDEHRPDRRDPVRSGDCTVTCSRFTSRSSIPCRRLRIHCDGARRTFSLTAHSKQILVLPRSCRSSAFAPSVTCCRRPGNRVICRTRNATT